MSEELSSKALRQRAIKSVIVPPTFGGAFLDRLRGGYPPPAKWSLPRKGSEWRVIRENQGFSTHELAYRLNVHPRLITRFESDDTGSFTPAELKELEELPTRYRRLFQRKQGNATP